MSATLFEASRKNLAVRNEADISTSYGEITKRLNKDFWDNLESATTHCRQVGSYGRNTAIHGISDLDMIFDFAGQGPGALQEGARQRPFADVPGGQELH